MNNYIKLDKEDLFLVLNEDFTNLWFEYEGKKVAELTNKGKVDVLNGVKLPYGYKSEMQNTIKTFLNKSSIIKTSNAI